MKKLIWFTALIILALPVIYLAAAAVYPFTPFLIFDLGPAVLTTLAGNTFVLCLISTFLAVVIGTSGALMVVFYSFRGKKIIETLLILPIILPPYMVAMVYKEATHFGPALFQHLFESLWGCAVVFALTLYPYVFILTKISFHNQGKIYIEAGKSLGLNRLERIKKILIPMAYPSIFLGLLLVFMEVISDYGTVSIMGVRTFTTGIYDVWFSMFNSRLAIRISLLMLVFPLALLFLYWIKTRRAKVYNPANRPGTGRQHHVDGWTQGLFFAAGLIPPLFGFLIPTAVLFKWCFATLHKVNLNAVVNDIIHSLSLALVVCLACILLGLVFSYTGRLEKRSLWPKAVTWLINMNYAIPGIAIAISLLYLTGSFYRTIVGEWLSNTAFFLIFACIIRYLCFAFFSIESGMNKISHRLDEAAVCIGKSRIYTLLHIHLPLLNRSMIIGAALVFISMTKELTMTMVLQPFNYSSLAVRVFRYANVDMLKESSVFAVCLILISIYPALSVNRWLNVRQQVEP